MDLRRAIFLKTPLHESMNNSLNSSSASAYESAAEDFDNSIYYSFSESQDKSLAMVVEENSIKSNDQDVEEVDEQNSISSSECDKENTVIMRKSLDIQADVSMNEPAEEKEVFVVKDDPVINISSENEIEEIPMNLARKQEINSKKTVILIVPEIIIEDPNRNALFNPFTMSAASTSASALSTIQEQQEQRDSSTPERRLNQGDLKKKSASKIPTRSHFYSPVQRKSIDKKTKINFKPPQVPAQKRRTIYDTRSSKIAEVPKLTTISPVNEVKPIVKKSTATAPPQPKSTIKPTLYKCTVTGCNREFRLLKTYQDHQKFHNTKASSSSSSASTSSSSSTSSFKCNWCDKSFDLESALNNHKLEKCSKIPFSEKRKLIAQEEKKEKTVDKRKSMFVAPLPKKRSPSRRQTINRSGVTITPKKTLKCHKCNKLFNDVLEFANHTISHKYEAAVGHKA